jgi:hypothetical protein
MQAQQTAPATAADFISNDENNTIKQRKMPMKDNRSTDVNLRLFALAVNAAAEIIARVSTTPKERATTTSGEFKACP